MLSLNDLREQNLILFEATSGSRAYGLATATSDTDIKGIFYLPRHLFFASPYIPQISNASHDIVYYELGRAIELLLQSNPTLLELLASPSACIRFRHPIMNALRLEWFISKACCQSFAGYALGQIRKARGLNKKINNPISVEKKSILDFCYVIENAASLPLPQWLLQNNRKQSHIGLSAIRHAPHLYALFYDEDGSRGYRGIMKKNDATNLLLSSIEKGATPLSYLSFNQEAYSRYCRDYAAYRHWEQERNHARYAATQAHGQGYDAKNMMHTFRLLEMARDIAQYGEIRVHRPNREALLEIKSGALCYETLTTQAQSLMQEVETAFAQSQLPEAPNHNAARQALNTMREQLYC